MSCDEIPLGAFASGSHCGNGEWVVLPLHVYQVIDSFLAGQNVLLSESFFHYQVSQRNHLLEEIKNTRMQKNVKIPDI